MERCKQGSVKKDASEAYIGPVSLFGIWMVDYNGWFVDASCKMTKIGKRAGAMVVNKISPSRLLFETDYSFYAPAAEDYLKILL